MFGFYYASIGLVFGILCSIKGKENDLNNEDWFILGFIFNIFSLIALIQIIRKKKNHSACSINSYAVPNN